MDGPWHSSVAAFEHFDSGRSHRFRCATFSGSTDHVNRVTAAKIANGLPTPYNILSGERGEKYVYGGAYGDFAAAPGSYVARIDANGEERWRIQLLDAPANPERWNYPGVAGIHANGFLYVAYSNELAKIDRTDGAVISRTALPVTALAHNSTYNGFNAFADGNLVMKSVNRANDCALQGFSAFLRCDRAAEVANSMIAVVDPKTMQVIASVEAREHIGGRLTTARVDGIDRLYVVGAQNVYRYNWAGNALTYDDEWGPVKYILPRQTPAPAAAVLGEWIVLQTNAVPAKTPMSVVAINQRNGRLVRVNPWENVPPWNYTIGSKSFLPAMLSVDPENSRVYIFDGGYGLAAAYAFNQETGKFRRLWMKRQRTLNFSTLIGPDENRILISTDIRGLCLFMSCFKEYAKEEVVFRNAETGREVARSKPLPKMTTGALVTPGDDGALFYLGLAGEIFRIDVEAKE
jgi:hypothetical protein